MNSSGEVATPVHKSTCGSNLTFNWGGNSSCNLQISNNGKSPSLRRQKHTSLGSLWSLCLNYMDQKYSWTFILSSIWYIQLALSEGTTGKQVQKLSWYWLLLTCDLITESQPSCSFWAVPKTSDLNSFFYLLYRNSLLVGHHRWVPLTVCWGQWIEFWFTAMTPDRYFVAINCDMGTCSLCCKLHRYSQVISLLVSFNVRIFQYHFHHNSHYIVLFKLHLPWLPQNILGSRKKGCQGWGIRSWYVSNYPQLTTSFWVSNGSSQVYKL
jgi:hypothetical protein